MSVDLMITLGYETLVIPGREDGERGEAARMVSVRRALPGQPEVNVTLSTALQILGLAREAGYDDLGLDRGDAGYTVVGRSGMRAFAEALERGAGEISDIPLAWEETGGPGTGQARMIARPTHVGPTSALGGKAATVMRVVEAIRYGLVVCDLTDADPDELALAFF